MNKFFLFVMVASVSLVLFACGDDATVQYTATFNLTTYDASNDDATLPAAQTVASGELFTEPATDPSHSGSMTFNKWVTDGTDSSVAAYDFTTPATANITLYAVFQ